MISKSRTFIAFLLTFLNFFSIQAQNPCSAQFTWIDSVASGSHYLFMNANNPSFLSQYSWVVSGNGISQTFTGPNAVYQNIGQGTYTVCLFVSDSSFNCQNSNCDTVSIGSSSSSCQANFTSSINPNGVATFTNTSTGSGTYTYAWDFGDGSTSSQMNPTHVYANHGSYTACLTISNGTCTNTYCSTITYGNNNNCTADFFAYDSTSAGTFNNLIYTYNNSNGSANATYAWTISGPNNFGYTTSGNNPTFQTPGAGTYVICMTMTDGSCSDSTCQTITLGSTSGCLARFTWSVSGTTLYTANQSNGVNFYWSLTSNGVVVATSNLMNPTFPVQAGNYSLCLTVIDSSQGCSDYACQNINLGTTNGVVTVSGNGTSVTFNLNSGITITCNSFGNMPITPGTTLCITSNVPVVFVTPQNDTLFLDSCYVAVGCDSLGNVILTNINGLTVIIPSGSTATFAPRHALTSADKMNFTQMSVYPNPNQGTCNIRTNEQMKKVVVYQLTGTKVFEQQVNGLDFQLKLPNVASGLYILEVETESGVGRSRIQIQ